MGFWDWLMGTPPQQRGLPSVSTRAQRGTVFGLRVGDVVAFEDVDYLVKNRIAYNEGGFTWQDYLLADSLSGNELWLSVEDDDGLQLGIFHVVDLGLTLPPVPRTLSYDGATYRQTETGQAAVSIEREDAMRSTQTHVQYWEFEAPGEQYMTVTRWGGEYEAAVGRGIEPFEVRVYPATS